MYAKGSIEHGMSLESEVSFNVASQVKRLPARRCRQPTKPAKPVIQGDQLTIFLKNEATDDIQIY